MIHLLAVGDPASLGGEPPPSFEVLHAASAEEAVEKLARNRRIDALLFLDAALAAETLALLAEDSAVSPPMFYSGPGPAPAGAAEVPPGDLFENLGLLYDAGCS